MRAAPHPQTKLCGSSSACPSNHRLLKQKDEVFPTATASLRPALILVDGKDLLFLQTASQTRGSWQRNLPPSQMGAP